MPQNSNKTRRQLAIQALVAQRVIASQQELLKAVAQRGHVVTQATLSRDLQKLRIARVRFDAGYRYLPSDTQLAMHFIIEIWDSAV